MVFNFPPQTLNAILWRVMYCVGDSCPWLNRKISRAQNETREKRGEHLLRRQQTEQSTFIAVGFIFINLKRQNNLIKAGSQVVSSHGWEGSKTLRCWQRLERGDHEGRLFNCHALDIAIDTMAWLPISAVFAGLFCSLRLSVVITVVASALWLIVFEASRLSGTWWSLQIPRQVVRVFPLQVHLKRGNQRRCLARLLVAFSRRLRSCPPFSHLLVSFLSPSLFPSSVFPLHLLGWL